ncbi:MAG: hypothetical protein EBT94_10190, partial [Alphaproteobacteria bacterium]|nr:hypothetical protein [Alphaproteobacteria bacterium]
MSLDTQQKHKVACFLHGESIHAKEGDDVLMKITYKQNEYKGKVYDNYSSSASSIKMLTPKQETTQTAPAAD